MADNKTAFKVKLNMADCSYSSLYFFAFLIFQILNSSHFIYAQQNVNNAMIDKFILTERYTDDSLRFTDRESGKGADVITFRYDNQGEPHLGKSIMYYPKNSNVNVCLHYVKKETSNDNIWYYYKSNNGLQLKITDENVGNIFMQLPEGRNKLFLNEMVFVNDNCTIYSRLHSFYTEIYYSDKKNNIPFLLGGVDLDMSPNYSKDLCFCRRTSGNSIHLCKGLQIGSTPGKFDLLVDYRGGKAILVSQTDDFEKKSNSSQFYACIEMSKREVKLYEPIEIKWICYEFVDEFQPSDIQFRYKLDCPQDWLGGIKYNINKWSDWFESNKGSLTMSDFVIEGNYKVTVQFRNKITAESSGDFEESFAVYWEKPEIREEAFTINWDKVAKASTESEKNKVLADEYKNAYEMWNKKYLYEYGLLKSTVSPEETMNNLVKKVGEGISQDALISMLKVPSRQIVKKVITPFEVYDLIKAGSVDLILIYRNIEANKAASMTAVCYWAWQYFENNK